MPTTNCSDTADEMLPLFALGREEIVLELTYIEPRLNWSDEVEIDPLDERDEAADREGENEVGTSIRSNQGWIDPLPGYPASSATYVAVICPYCGRSHRVEQCPRVEEIEYYRSGAIRRVRLRPILAEVSGVTTVSSSPPPANDSGEP